VIISLVLVLLVTAAGTLASYLYDEDVNFAARLCAGACIGIAALGLVGFVLASFLGLTPLAILLTLLITVALPILSLGNPDLRALVRQDLRATSRSIRQAFGNPTGLQLGYTVFYFVVAAILWRAFQRAMIETPDGIFTGLLNNFGDLPFHVSVITSFAFGNNFPPQDPTYAGVRFTYPFLTDFVSAIFVRCGADLRQSMFLENFVVALAFVGLIHRWALEMLRDKLAAILTPILVLLNGGVGWILLWDQVTKNNKNGLVGILQGLPPSFTVIPETTWRWGNAMSTLLIPQRGFLLGLPLAVIVFTQWWLSDEKRGEKGKREKGEQGKQREGVQGKRGRGKGKKQKLKKEAEIDELRIGATAPLPVSPFPFFPLSPSIRRMIAAGVIAGLLPLVHAHSFVVVIVVGGCIAIAPYWRSWVAIAIGALPLIYIGYYSYPLLPRLNQNIAVVVMATAGALAAWILLPRSHRALWTWFFGAALIIALPQMWWSTHNSAVDAGKFFEWQFGWDHGQENPFWFWLKNTGLFIPLTLAALLWRHAGKALVSRKLLVFYLPFTLCFIIPNVLKMAPWIWDNIKVLFYWWLASAPLVALLLARLWRQGIVRRAIAICLLACVTLAGGLDVAAIVLRSNEYGIFNAPGIQFAELIKREAPPQAVVIHAPVHNHPVFLTGRRSLMGYPGHVWTHGLEFGPRESEIRRVYAGAPDATAILRKYGVDYAVVSPLEKNIMNVNDQFFSSFQLVGEVGEYRLYKIKQ
jgi:hypothetical protein